MSTSDNVGGIAIQLADCRNPQQEAEPPLALPPGFAGTLAHFILGQAIRPVPEVAMTGALGLLAGIAGCRWSVSNTGLNLYLVLVARSGIGKEAMPTGISALVKACDASFATSGRRALAGKHVLEAELGSGPALVSVLSERSSFVALMGEFGHVFREMADKRNPAMRSLRKQLTLLLSGSGITSSAGGIIRAKQADSTKIESKVAFSLVGDCTPGSFYSAATAGMMEDGFMSRFTVVDYPGERPDKNDSQVLDPAPELVERLCAIIERAAKLEHEGRFVAVGYTPEGFAELDAFALDCDANIRAADEDESIRQVWNRAHLKALRIAALLAVADDYESPVIGTEHATWAIALIRQGVATFLARLEAGDIGGGDDFDRHKKVVDACRKWCKLKPQDVPKEVRGYGHLAKSGIVPMRYLSQQVGKLAAFTGKGPGSSRLLDIAIQSALDGGDLVELTKNELGGLKLSAKTRAFKLSDAAK